LPAKFERNYSVQMRQKNARFVDYALKIRGIKYFNVENWLLFAPYQNFWPRACIQISVIEVSVKCRRWGCQKTGISSA